MSIATGLALLLTNGIPVYGMPKFYVDSFGRGLWLELPTAVYLTAAIVVAVWIMQNFTRAGRYIYAIGGNLQAATVSGVRTKTYLVLAYSLCSVLASISGLMLTAQIGSGQAVINSQLTLESIAAAVIAGVSLKGGVGRVEMVTLAAFFLLDPHRRNGPVENRSAHPVDLPRRHRRACGRGGGDGQAERFG